jgi:hypothetical protein
MECIIIMIFAGGEHDCVRCYVDHGSDTCATLDVTFPMLLPKQAKALSQASFSTRVQRRSHIFTDRKFARTKNNAVNKYRQTAWQ